MEIERILWALKTPTHIRGLARKLEINVSLLHRTLKKLEKEGLILSERKGKKVIYKLNKANPETKQYLRLYNIKRNLSRLNNVKGVVFDFLYLAKKTFGNNLIAVYVFGSTAKNTRKKHSDVDVFLVLKKLPSNLNERRKEILKITKEILLKHKIKLDIVEYDLVDIRHNDSLLKEIKKHHIKIMDKVGVLS